MKNIIVLIDNALEELLEGSGLTFHIESQEKFSFQIPQKKWVDAREQNKPPAINIYLFDIQEVKELKRHDYPIKSVNNGKITQKRANTFIDLFYIITVYGQKAGDGPLHISISEQEHQLLGELLKVILNHEYIPQKYLYDDAYQPSLPKIFIELAQLKLLGSESGPQIWSALDQYLKPALYLKVRVPIDIDKKIESAMVISKMMRLGIPSSEHYYSLATRPSFNNNYTENDDIHISKLNLTKDIVSNKETIEQNQKDITIYQDNNITLATTASSDDNAYNNMIITVKNDIGNTTDTKTVIDYVGATKVATVDSPWTTLPGSTYTYEIASESANVISAMNCNITEGDLLIITDGHKTEFITIDSVVDLKLTTEKEILYQHGIGTEIIKIDIDNAQLLKDIHFVSAPEINRNELKIFGDDVKELQKDDLICLKDDNNKIEYLQIVKKSEHNIDILDQHLKIGGIVTKNKDKVIPIKDATVTLSNGSTTVQTKTTGNGHFAFNHLDIASTSYQIIVQASGYQEETVDLFNLNDLSIQKMIIYLQPI